METTHQPHDQPAETPQPPEAIWTWQRREKASAIAESYRGTPHSNRRNIPGEGVDCIHFVLSVLHGAGIIPPVRLPFYDERLGTFRDHNVLEDLFVQHFHVETKEISGRPDFGDVVITQCGRQANHCGIILDGWFWHVAANGFCCPEDWNAWKFRAQSLVRFVATGTRADPNKLSWAEIKSLAHRKS